MIRIPVRKVDELLVTISKKCSETSQRSRSFLWFPFELCTSFPSNTSLVLFILLNIFPDILSRMSSMGLIHRKSVVASFF